MKKLTKIIFILAVLLMPTYLTLAQTSEVTLENTSLTKIDGTKISSKVRDKLINIYNDILNMSNTKLALTSLLLPTTIALVSKAKEYALHPTSRKLIKKDLASKVPTTLMLGYGLSLFPSIVYAIAKYADGKRTKEDFEESIRFALKNSIATNTMISIYASFIFKD